jgi:hypothetical protein
MTANATNEKQFHVIKNELINCVFVQIYTPSICQLEAIM